MASLGSYITLSGLQFYLLWTGCTSQGPGRKQKGPHMVQLKRLHWRSPYRHVGRVKGANKGWGSTLGLMLLGSTQSRSMDGALAAGGAVEDSGIARDSSAKARREQGRTTLILLSLSSRLPLSCWFLHWRVQSMGSRLQAQSRAEKGGQWIWRGVGWQMEKSWHFRGSGIGY